MDVTNTLSAKKIEPSGCGVRGMNVGHRVLDPRNRHPDLQHLCALAVMTKAPRPGQVKTRLIPPLTPLEAAELNRCFLRDTAAAILRASGENARGVGVYTPRGAEADYVDILPSDFDLLPQRDGNFGERLVGAAEDLFQVGFASVCLIDSDSPTVRTEYGRAAKLLSLPGDRVVLGPSDDGGYYLIGLKKLHHRLFEEIDWSTERVLEQTIARAKQLNVSIEFLPCGYDVDGELSLRRLRDELLASDAGSATEIAPHTREFLARLAAQRDF